MKKRIFFILFLFLTKSSLSVAQSRPSPPLQPKDGPGGSATSHSGVHSEKHAKGATAWWIFLPEEPAPATAPLIVFLHGWGAMNPTSYGAWIEHLAKRGNIVLYPIYQDSLATPPHDFTPNVITAYRDALVWMQSAACTVKPELNHVAYAGHSAGGVQTMNLAARAGSEGLPQAKAIMPIQPGKTWPEKNPYAFPLEDLSAIPSSTLMLVVTSDGDKLVKDVDAWKIWNNTPQIPAPNKNFLELRSDDHGSPALNAGHLCACAFGAFMESPTAPTAKCEGLPPLRDQLGRNMLQSDALDFYGTWKLLDALCDAAFHNKNRAYALGDTPQQRNMGTWSDGTPAKEIRVVK